MGIALPDMFAQTGFNQGWNYPALGLEDGIGGATYAAMKADIAEGNDIAKAFTRGDGIVQTGDEGGRTLAVQYLRNLLQSTTFGMNNAVLMQRISKEQVYSVAHEYSQINRYGGPGHGYIPETGQDNAFGLVGEDATFKRQIANLRIQAAYTLIGIIASQQRNIQDPRATLKKALTRQIIMRETLGAYFGDNFVNALQPDGFIAMIRNWVDSDVGGGDYGIMFDAGGRVLDADLLNEAISYCSEKFGSPSVLFQSKRGEYDTERALFPNMRGEFGSSGTFGGDHSVYKGADGEIKRIGDAFLRRGDALAVDGPGATGLPRTVADANAPGFNTTPYGAAVPAAIAAGAGSFWNFFTKNTESVGLTTVPATPSGDNNTNRLAAGIYYYAVAPVYDNREGLWWIYGEAAANTFTGGQTGIAPTAGQVNRITIDGTTPCIVGLGTGFDRNRMAWRIYRAGGPGMPVPTSINDYKYVGTTGTPRSGNPIFYDNGFRIPGSDNAFLITENKDGMKCWDHLELTPLMERNLADFIPMARPLMLLHVACPVFYAPAFNIHFRNVGTR